MYRYIHIYIYIYIYVHVYMFKNVCAGECEFLLRCVCVSIHLSAMKEVVVLCVRYLFLFIVTKKESCVCIVLCVVTNCGQERRWKA